MDYKLFYNGSTKQVEVFDFEVSSVKPIGSLELDEYEVLHFSPEESWMFDSSDLLKLGAFLSELEDNNTVKSLLV